MTDLHSASLHGDPTSGASRSERLDRAIHSLLSQTPELEAAAVVSFDGLPMAAALPPSMDEDRVAAMSAALLSLGERAAQGLGRGELSQVYIEGDAGTVFLVSCDDEAVLVAVASKGAKVGMMLYEVRRSAAVVADVLRAEDLPDEPLASVPAQSEPVAESLPAEPAPPASEPAYVATCAPTYVPTHAPVGELPSAPPPAAHVLTDSAWSSSYAPTGSVMPGGGLPPSTWS